ncbi:MAG: SurA N-terminal domain-containing protein [Candidatus Korobacteraceae bacterium]
MRRLFVITIFFVSLVSATTLPLFAGEILDGVVATVNRCPLLRSDWDEAVRFEAFMQQKPLSQVTDSDRVLALHRLIDRQLLKAQMGASEHVQPSTDELNQDLAKLRAQLPDGNDDAGWRELLTSYGLTEDVAKQHLRDEFEVMNFIEVRLRPTVHVTGDDIEAYYKDQLLPDLAKNGGASVSLSEVEPRIRELLTQQCMDELLDVWLHNLRQQAEIHSSIAIPGINALAESSRASGVN